VRCSDLIDNNADDLGLLFWVPETCREAICNKETLAVFRKCTTRLDLNQFTHGTSWTQCRSALVSGLEFFINYINPLMTLHLDSADTICFNRQSPPIKYTSSRVASPFGSKQLSIANPSQPSHCVCGCQLCQSRSCPIRVGQFNMAIH
jgi:hypothetical protein